MFSEYQYSYLLIFNKNSARFSKYAYYNYAPHTQRCKPKHEHNEERNGKYKQEPKGTFD